jgi:hypothetical protein
VNVRLAGQSTAQRGAVTPVRSRRSGGPRVDFGSSADLVNRFIARAESLTPDQAEELFHARASHMMWSGGDVERQALARASDAALRSGRLAAYLEARHEAAAAWRRARRGTLGPWLTVAGAVTNAAGALVVQDLIDDRTYATLYGPWSQAFGTNLVPVGPGFHAPVIRSAPRPIARTR